MNNYRWGWAKSSDSPAVTPNESKGELVDSFREKIVIQRGNLLAAVLKSNPNLASWVAKSAYLEALKLEVEELEREKQD